MERSITMMMPLDDALPADQIGPRGLIKIDVEGAEALVFQGMQKTLAMRPDIIVESFDQRSCDSISALVLPLGYRVALIREDEADVVYQDRLYARNRQQSDFNQLLTVRP